MDNIEKMAEEKRNRYAVAIVGTKTTKDQYKESVNTNLYQGLFYAMSEAEAFGLAYEQWKIKVPTHDLFLKLVELIPDTRAASRPGCVWVRVEKESDLPECDNLLYEWRYNDSDKLHSKRMTVDEAKDMVGLKFLRYLSESFPSLADTKII